MKMYIVALVLALAMVPVALADGSMQTSVGVTDGYMNSAMSMTSTSGTSLVSTYGSSEQAIGTGTFSYDKMIGTSNSGLYSAHVANLTSGSFMGTSGSSILQYTNGNALNLPCGSLCNTCAPQNTVSATACDPTLYKSVTTGTSYNINSGYVGTETTVGSIMSSTTTGSASGSISMFGNWFSQTSGCDTDNTQYGNSNVDTVGGFINFLSTFKFW